MKTTAAPMAMPAMALEDKPCCWYKFAPGELFMGAGIGILSAEGLFVAIGTPVVEDWALDEVWADSDAKEDAAMNEVVAIVDVVVLDEAVSLVLDEARTV